MFLHAEFIYQARPTAPQRRRWFDHTFRQRLNALTRGSRVLLIADSAASLDSLRPLLVPFAHLAIDHAIVRPQPRPKPTDTPFRCAWDTPADWQQMDMSDRWVRMLTALRWAASHRAGWLILPAHEAIYTPGLLAALVEMAETRRTQTGRWHAVSPISRPPTPHRRAADAAPTARDLLTAAFDRELLDATCAEGQGFWGKMGVIPSAVCTALSQTVQTDAWEDDLEIDSALVALGHATACQRFDRADYQLHYGRLSQADVQTIITRHLHYSLKIPGEHPSALQGPPSRRSLKRAARSAYYARALHLADALIAQADAAMRVRQQQVGASWVDWGAYRYVAQTGNPAVEVWKRGGSL